MSDISLVEDLVNAVDECLDGAAREEARIKVAKIVDEMRFANSLIEIPPRDLDLKWAAASEFIRDVIEALGKPQPTPEAIVDLPSLALEVVGRIEELKASAAPMSRKAFVLWETNMQGHSQCAGVALTSEDASAWTKAWFPQGCSRTSIAYNIIPQPLPQPPESETP